jgi:hypothetical protein
LGDTLVTTFARIAYCIIWIVIVPALAEASPKQKPSPTSISTLNGRCEKLVVQGMDATASCSGKVLNTLYRDNRSGFYFVTADGAALTFSGLGNLQVKPDPDSAIQPVDMIIFGYKGQHDRSRAVGQCAFQNPNKGPSRVQCRATTSAGVFKADFVSDGHPPHVMKF